MDPITGPFTSTITPLTVGGLPLTIRTQTWYRQKRPYNKPLPFTFRYRLTRRVSSWPILQADNTVGGVGDFQAYEINSSKFDGVHSSRIEMLKTSALNKALGKFQAIMSDPSETLTSLVESQKTISMVERRLTSMVTFAKRWRAGSYKSALRVVLNAQKFTQPRLERKRKRMIIGLMGKPKSYHKSKTLAGAWLETWMGWLPTIGDVQKSITNLSREFPDEYMVAKASYSEAWRDTLDGNSSWFSSHKCRAFASVSAVVKVTNPNLYMASQLGLTNPIYTAYQVIPYSWLLSWFNNMDQYMKQFSQYHGVQVSSPCYTTGLLDEHEFLWTSNGSSPRGEQRCVSFQRSLGLPGITLQWRGLNRLSMSRGATLSSLLVGWLPRTSR